MTVSYRACCRKPGSRDCGKALMPEKLRFVQLSATTSTSANGLSAKTKRLHTGLDTNMPSLISPYVRTPVVNCLGCVLVKAW